MGTKTVWWENLVVCPACGSSVSPSNNKPKDSCVNCKAEWSQRGNILEWKGESKGSKERLFPLEWIEESKSKGARKLLYLVKRLLWNLMKFVAFPLRFLLKYRLDTFQKRSLTDDSLAQQWKLHYFKGLTIPSEPLIFEYSYRKIEKVGFAGLLGHKAVIQDIREHSWWSKFPDVLFQIVPSEYRQLPLPDDSMDIVFTDGVIFDMDELALKAYIEECYRILRSGGYLIVWGGNSLSWNRARFEIQWHGRIHSADIIREMAKDATFIENGFSFEGYSPPIFPRAINTIRKACAPWTFKTYDCDSWLARYQKPEDRAYWLLKFQKPTNVPSDEQS